MADKIYCYPDTGILKNRMNIHDAGRFSEAEIRFVSIRLYQLYANPISGSFDFAHLCRIHHHIFQDLYGWAGKTRTVNIAKGNSLFCPAWNISGYADDVFRCYYKDCMRAKTAAVNLYIYLLHITQILTPCILSERETDAARENTAANCAYNADIYLI